MTEAFPSHANTLFHEQNTSQFEVRDSPMVNSGIGTEASERFRLIWMSGSRDKFGK